MEAVELRPVGRMKRLELAWKAVWLKLLCIGVRVAARPPRPVDWRTEPCRILFLRPDRIGDAIVTTGIFREIVEGAPNVTLDVLCTPRNRAVLEGDPHISRLHVFDRRLAGVPKLARELRACRYDGVIDCMVTAPSMTTLLLMLISGARHRIGISGRGIDDALTVPVERNSAGTHITDLLAAFGPVFGITAGADWRPRLYPAEQLMRSARARWESGTGRRRVLVNVSAGKPARNWPEEHFVAAIRAMRERYTDAGFLVIGAPGEWDRVERIARAAAVPAAPTPQLEDAIGLVATATFVLTPDTSIAHMASALATPAVVMYLKGTSKLWGLYGAEGIELEAAGQSLSDLPLRKVLQAVEQVLGSSRSAGTPGSNR